MIREIAPLRMGRLKVKIIGIEPLVLARWEVRKRVHLISLIPRIVNGVEEYISLAERRRREEAILQELEARDQLRALEQHEAFRQRELARFLREA